VARVRVLHPDFGLFWPSRTFLRKLCIAAAFLAGGVIAGTQGILLLSGEEERDARTAFALAPPEPATPPPASRATVERTAPSVTEKGPRSIIMMPPPPSILAQPQRPEPKVIRVERKPMQSIEPKIASKSDAKSPCRSEAGGCTATERTIPATTADRVDRPLPAPVQVTNAPALPESASPSVPAESMPGTPESTPESVVTAVPPPTVVRPPVHHQQRRVTREVSRSRPESSRSYSYSYSYHPARQGGGYAGLW
jgi:hypothetical protein